MSGQQRTVEELVAELVERLETDPATDLEALLALHPEHGSEIRRRIDILRAAGLLPRAPGNGTRTPDPLEPIRQRLERRGDFPLRYALAGELGRGGMGRILEAREDDLQRTVAMKVFHPRDGNGAPDPALVGRFLHEARITAQLDHPGIVPVHELGLDDQGQLYFTMRMVSGEDLRQVYEHVATGHDGWNQPRALGVLLKVCEALGYAHEKRVIHRDLKPANVMVGKHGEVYVMDWGLARVLGQHDPFDLRIRPEAEADPGETPGVTPAGAPGMTPPPTRTLPSETPPGQAGREHASDSPLVTRNGDIIGTPAYMPPEQARGDLAALGPQSDVYAVGAMLYQLLAGTMPFVEHGKRPSPRAILRRVLAGPPVALVELAPKAPPELVAICEKAMAREPGQRYANTTELAEDLRAFLELRMVRAYRTGAWIEAKKWVQRNTPLALALLGVLLALGGGAIAFKLKADEATRTAAFATLESKRADAKAKESEANAQRARDEATRADKNAADASQSAQEAHAQAVRADDARKLAEKRADETQQVADFEKKMLKDLSVDEFGHALVVELSNTLAEELRRRGTDEAGVMGALTTFEQSLAGANPTTAASRVLESQILGRQADEIEKQFGAQPVIAAKLLTAIGHSAEDLGMYELSERVLRRALELREADLGHEHDDTLASMKDLARVLQQYSDKLPEAETLCREAVDIARRTMGMQDQQTLATIATLESIVLGRGKLGEAESLAREAEAGYRTLLGDTHAETLKAISNLAQVLESEGKRAEAMDLYQEALEGFRTTLGEAAPETLTAYNQRAIHMHALGDLDEAERLDRLVLAGRRKLLGDDHHDTQLSMSNLEVLLAERGKFAEAEPLLVELLAARRTKLGNSHHDTLTSINNLGVLRQQMGRLSEAEALGREAYEGRRKLYGDDAYYTLESGLNLAMALRALGRHAEAEPIARDVLPRMRKLRGDDDSATLTAMNNLAWILEEEGKRSEAEPLYAEALAGRRRTAGEASPLTLNATLNMAGILRAQGKLKEAEPLNRQSLEGYRKVYGPDHPETLRALAGMASIMRGLNRRDEAETLSREAMEGYKRKFGEDNLITLRAASALASLLVVEGKLEEAEPMCRKTLEGLQAKLGEQHPYTLAAKTTLAELLMSQGKLRDAESLFRQAVEASTATRGAEHPETLYMADHLALVLSRQGRISEAVALARENLEKASRSLGETHATTKEHAKRLALLLEQQEAAEPGKGHKEEAEELRSRLKL